MSGVKIILSNNPETESNLFKIRMPLVQEVMYLFLVTSKVLPFFITVATFKCLISNFDDDQPVMKFIAYAGMIVYHFCLVCLHQNSAKPGTRIQTCWLDIDMHRLLFLLFTLVFDMVPRFAFAEYTLIFFYKSIRIFDRDIVTRTGDVSPSLHFFNRKILKSTYYQRTRAFSELLWFPYIIIGCVISLEIEKVVFLYYYFVFIVIFQFQFDDFHQWIWLQIDHFFTIIAFDQPDTIRSILLQTFFHIRKCGALGKMLFPQIEEEI
ncbi:hypothetical protein TRFO_14770 [Tritrichomonas foetus]|uniref:Uncharacterized protein n=1 Tax=Tritrichomonas foetus TaxID=1144522 RepID=A0A1J4KU83_9EUKA|nr:hypothetical protein TRFO_14770 [Tritrichomonas foetus]|eukprot:OHT14827.1 hypothetical protein TRFO_14770 [Tritrichomonas foetus]